ncbi:MAG TPA: hypothetical protein VGC35_03085 [Allosphingosinicella sp.]|jgi:hypothetical protein
MVGKLKLNRLDIVAVVAVIVSTILCIEAALHAADAYTHFRPISGAKQMLGVIGWIIATFGPIGVAVCFWRLAKRVRAPWVVHLLFLPCAYALLMAGVYLMLFVIGDPDFDSTLGGPVMQAALLFAAASVLYFGAAIYRSWRAWH